MRYLLFIICFFTVMTFAQDRGSAIFMKETGDDIGAVTLSFQINNTIQQDKHIKKTKSVHEYQMAIKFIFQIPDDFFSDGITVFPNLDDKYDMYINNALYYSVY